MVNRSLGNLLSFAGNKPKQWNPTLSQVEFAYNQSKNRMTQLSFFLIVYGQNPSGLLDLAPIPCIGRLSIKDDEMVDYLQGVHNQVKKAIEEQSCTKHNLTTTNAR